MFISTLTIALGLFTLSPVFSHAKTKDYAITISDNEIELVSSKIDNLNKELIAYFEENSLKNTDEAIIDFFDQGNKITGKELTIINEADKSDTEIK